MSYITARVVELKGHKTVWFLKFDLLLGRLFIRYRNGAGATYVRVPQPCFDDVVASLRAGEEFVWVFPGLSESHHLNFPIEWWTPARKRTHCFDREGYVVTALSAKAGRSSYRAKAPSLSQLPAKRNGI